MPEPQDIRLSPQPSEDPKPSWNLDSGETNAYDCVKDCTRPAGHYGACINP